MLKYFSSFIRDPDGSDHEKIEVGTLVPHSLKIISKNGKLRRRKEIERRKSNMEKKKRIKRDREE